MPISILELSRADSGTTQAVQAEFSTIEDVELKKPAKLSISLTNISHDLFTAHVIGDVELILDCHRCLKRFAHTLSLDFTATFSDNPEEGEWLIHNNQVDLSEPLRQEILFLLPSPQLCKTKCTGI